MAKAIEQVLEMAKDVELVDIRFTDLPGTWQHFTMPVHRLTEGFFEDGIPFDGSSIRGFQEIHESDMLLKPDPDTAFVDPTAEIPTLVLNCNVYDPLSFEAYSRDPRYVALKAEDYLKSTGIADTAYFAPEAEFFVFDGVRYASNSHEAFYSIHSEEAWWTSERSDAPNYGGQIAPKRGYFPVPPTDTLHTLRSRFMLAMEKAGVQMDLHHHEVATAGQSEMSMTFTTLTRMADNLLLYKYIIKNVARQYGKTVTFMPKPLFGDNGSGMHVHSSLWKGDTNVFFDEDGYAGLSQTAKYYIGGILKHAPALLALTSPTTNSYRRLVPGYEAPVNIAYSQRNRSAICRIPATKNYKAKRVEFRAPDPTCNPYLAFSAILMAGLDGICNEIDPGDPRDMDLYELPAEEKQTIQQVPSSLSEVLDALEADHEFLLQGGVFTSDLLEEYIKYKRVHEVDAIRLRPTPHEFTLYFDA
ncbi:MAG TPA: type I glutamate--ammonia ligase [Anaerolineales bacterium]|nr:type I glutamate--ammonia ligase [Anaerolineales bacterium]